VQRRCKPVQANDCLTIALVVLQYLGELVESRYAVEGERNFLFDYTRDYVVDALRQGNKTRYMNHSSDPNVDVVVLLVNGVKRIGFFASRDIPAQSEVRPKLETYNIRGIDVFLFATCRLTVACIYGFKLFYNYGDMFVSEGGNFRWQRPGSKGNEQMDPKTLVCGVCEEDVRQSTTGNEQMNPSTPVCESVKKRKFAGEFL
jgi:SET domain